jgi:hypothetical protein
MARKKKAHKARKAGCKRVKGGGCLCAGRFAKRTRCGGKKK